LIAQGSAGDEATETIVATIARAASRSAVEGSSYMLFSCVRDPERATQERQVLSLLRSVRLYSAST
jgi:hypothetical protein